jgi:multiple sugar transport system permease protein
VIVLSLKRDSDIALNSNDAPVLTKKKKFTSERAREERAFWIFISPWIIGFILFIGGPIVASLYLSFTSYNVIEPAAFNGIQNYIALFDDKLFYQSLKVTVYYVALAVPFQIVIGLLLAVLLNQKVRGLPFFRTMFYAPTVISGVSVAFLWSWLLNPDFGIVNSFLANVGIDGPGWFTDKDTVIPSMVLMQLTSIGGVMVIFLASLQSLPTDLYEAASIDGASVFRKFFRITVPLVSPVILFNTIMGIIGSFQIFTQAYVITKGGPDWMSYFYIYYLFETAFSQFRMGYASAQAWILFIIIFAFTMLSLWASKKLVHYEYDGKR